MQKVLEIDEKPFFFLPNGRDTKRETNLILKLMNGNEKHYDLGIRLQSRWKVPRSCLIKHFSVGSIARHVSSKNVVQQKL